MEYPARHDFFLSFKALFNSRGEFIDYILINFSENFKIVDSNKRPEQLIGKRLSELFIENEDNILGELYYHMLPNTRRKFERYIEKLDRWYLINIFSDDKNYLILFYTDITKLKSEIKKSVSISHIQNKSVIF